MVKQPAAAGCNCDVSGAIGVVVADPLLASRIAATSWLFPVFLASQRRQIKIVVRSQKEISATVKHRVGVKDRLTFAQEDTRPTLLAIVRRVMEVVVEVAAIRGEPRNGPVHACLEWLNLCQWCPGDHN